MKNLIKIICCVTISLFTQALFALEVTIYKESYLNGNPACPKTLYGYSVATSDSYGVYEWKITGGYIKNWAGQDVTEVSESGKNNISVTWNNVTSGTLSLKIYHKSNPKLVVAYGNLPQPIKSLNNVLPQTPQSSETALDYGIKSIRVTGQALNYPGVTKSGAPIPVNKYEWKLPAGWSVNGGVQTTSGTYTSTSSIVDITTDYGSIGSIEVRGINDCPNSNDYTQYSFPLNFTRKGLGLINYPATIVAGQSSTYSITATPISGATYEWQAPEGWSINNGGNTYSGTSNTISIKNGICMTSEKVKVRYKGTSQMYSEWMEVPSSMVAPAINLPSQVKQYHLAVFSLNIPDANVNSIIWKMNGVDMTTVYNTSTAQFAITEKGTVNVSAILSLNGCGSSITIPPVQVNVQETVLSISGPSHVCPGSTTTFTISNAPANYTWGCSSNLTPVSGSLGSFTTSSVGGSAWVSIRINGAEIIRKNFKIGSEIDGVEGIYSVLTTRYTPEPFCPGQVKMWTLDWQGRLITEKPDTVNGYSVFGMNYVDVKSTSAPGVMTIYDLSLIQENGVTATKWISVRDVKLRLVGSDKPKPIDPFPPIDFLLSPNPATSSVTISLQENEDTEDVQSHSALNRNTLTALYTIQLWNSYSLVKSVQTDLEEYQMDLHGIPAGFYYVLVIKDGQTYRKQLMVK